MELGGLLGIIEEGHQSSTPRSNLITIRAMVRDDGCWQYAQIQPEKSSAYEQARSEGILQALATVAGTGTGQTGSIIAPAHSSPNAGQTASPGSR